MDRILENVEFDFLNVKDSINKISFDPCNIPKENINKNPIRISNSPEMKDVSHNPIKLSKVDILLIFSIILGYSSNINYK
jgi:hypothetical protein